MLRDYYINETRLCGPDNFTIWDSKIGDFGPCFFNLFISLPIQSFLAIVSSYYLGYQYSQWFLRNSFQKKVLVTRGLVTFIIAVLPLIRVVATYLINRDKLMATGEAGLVADAVKGFSWFLHIGYTFALYQRISASIRGPNVAVVAWLLSAIAYGIESRSSILQSRKLESPLYEIILTTAIVNLCCIAIYFFSLIPAGDQRSSQYEEFGNRPERRESEQPLLFENGPRQRMMFSSYGGFHEDTDPLYLGVAKDSYKTNWLSKLFFVWANPLITKGGKGNLHTPEDLFDLPDKMTVHQVSQKFNRALLKLEKEIPYQDQLTTESSGDAASLDVDDGQPLLADGGPDEHPSFKGIGLIRVLYTCHGREFFAIGSLKLLNDLSGFAGPILLNLVVNFMENKDEAIWKGYLYAFLLALTSLVSAMASCHFNLFMSELGVKVRGAVTAAIYRKTVSVSQSEMGKFSRGQIINFMSTDTDRIVNFCPSLHAAWSLPFQFAVTLYLLYQQVGLSFLTGLGFTILVIPINKVIANRIGDLSTKMMSAKDQRVDLMSEILSGIRVIKYFNWNRYFTNRVTDSRSQELKHLKGRKYLDALCVYLWATTPVLISVLTFVTYTLLGNQLTAAKVFTSVALFAMLTGPLNAFPWVLNGLVESVVSVRRLEAFLDLNDFDAEKYFSRICDIVPATDTSTDYQETTQDSDDCLDDTRGENAISVAMDKAAFCHTAVGHQRQRSIEDSAPTSVVNIADPQQFQLENLSLSVTRSQFVGVVGAVGSGKSAFLEALLGELNLTNGRIAIDRSTDGVGYVKQEPWLQQGTIRDNILFGTAYQHNWYSKVVDACALTSDFSSLQAGDLTEVGEGGSKLSGGQKARVSLARAVYQNKELYLIDDVFSAVDTAVASHIYRKVIMGLLKYKTRIMCTHHTRYLAGADLIIRLGPEPSEAAGRGAAGSDNSNRYTIIDKGSPNLVFNRMTSESGTRGRMVYDGFSVYSSAITPNYGTPLETGDGRTSPVQQFSGAKKKTTYRSSLLPEGAPKTRQQENSRANTAGLEVNEQGIVKGRIYGIYANAVGKLLTVTILLSLIAMQLTKNLTDVWLAHWVGVLDHNNSTAPNTSKLELNHVWNGGNSMSMTLLPVDIPDGGNDFENDLEGYSGLGGDNGLSVKYYLIVYGTIAASNSIFSLFRAFLFAYGGVCAAKRIHQRLLRGLLRAKIVFFDNTPAGRILNRFSSDLYTVDDSLPFILNIFLANAVGVAGPLLVTVYAMPWISLVIIPLVFVYINIQSKYRPASRDLKRIGSTAMSPIYSHFNETLSGLSTLRGMQQVSRFVRENEEKLEGSLKSTYACQIAAQWLELRLQLIGCGVVTGVAIISIIQHHVEGGADPGMVGLAISYALGLTSKLSGLVTSFTETEREFVAVERVAQYIDHIEPENYTGSTTSPYDWPSEGVVTLKNVEFSYQPHLPNSLQGISFQTRAAEKVGIVGRTGAGKSSIFHVIYRLTEISRGEIYIDNVNIGHLDLNELREHLAIIPQEPFLFSGSVRENLDPVGYCNDRQLTDILKKARLDRMIARLGGLGAQITERGQALSAGQRQLLCLARAVLSPAKVVLVDEATANVDAETDQHIQEVMQTCLADRTVLTIAHRVNTVLRCDRVLIVEEGRVTESGHPNVLLQDGRSKFSKFITNR